MRAFFTYREAEDIDVIDYSKQVAYGTKTSTYRLHKDTEMWNVRIKSVRPTQEIEFPKKKVWTEHDRESQQSLTSS